MAIEYMIDDAVGQAMLDAITTFLDGGANEPGYALFVGVPGTDPNVIPAGAIIKWGNLNATAAFASASASGTGAARKVTITLNAESATQNDGTGASFPMTVGSLALFRNISIEGDLTNANMAIKGNVAAADAWCIIGSTTITAADVDLTEANCIIELPLTQST